LSQIKPGKTIAVDDNISPSSTNVEPVAAADRVLSIDALRGFDMFWIVGGRELVLAVAGAISGSVPAWLDYQLEHVEWEGFTAWDLIMPLFLFVVGAAMPFSFAKQLEHGVTKGQMYLKILRRTMILFILGMAAQGHLLDFDLSTLHIYCNTLQSIAAGYLVAGILLLNVGVVLQLLATAGLLVGYWLIMMYVPFGTYPAGTLEPNANVAMAVDEFVLGRFRDGTTYTWVLSSMTFAATVLLGVQAGHLLRTRLAPVAKFFLLVGIGLACLAGGWLWAERLNFPIIKHIWTSSMALWSGGLSFLLLALFYLVIDCIGLTRWAFFFVVIGANAITAYMAYHFIPFRDIAEGLAGGLARHAYRGGPVLIELTAVMIMWLALAHMYRHRIFVRV
jgi:predicted acyltransferase